MFVLASNHFRKCFSVNASVWLRMENKFSRKYFQLTVCFNGFNSEIGFSQNFHFKPFPDSHAKREREREKGRRESPDHAFDFDFTDLRTHEPIFDPEPSTHEPSTSPATQSLRATNPRTDLSLCVIFIFCALLIDPRTDLRFCVILIFSFSLWSLIFFFVVVVVWVVVENSIFRMLPNT